MLGLVRAEVARILGFKCESITALYEGRLLLEEGTQAWEQGALFVRFYQALYDLMDGNEAKMVHWLRRVHKDLGNSPFYLMVDEGRMADVLEYILVLLNNFDSRLRGNDESIRGNDESIGGDDESIGGDDESIIGNNESVPGKDK